MWTNEQFQAQLQQIRSLHTKIEVLNMNNQVVDYIEGLVISGNINISNSNMIRRTLNITFLANSKLEISPNSLLWMNKRLKVYVGIEDFNKKIHYFNQGIYVLSDPTTDISVDGRRITIQGSDKMKLFDIPFMSDIKFTVDTPINEAIKGLAELVGETNLLIENSEYKMPYDMQFSPTNDIQSALKDVVNLYMDYHCYYNVDGYLVFEKIKNRLSDISVWDFTDRMDMSINKSITTGYEDIKNHVKVIGKLNDKTAELPLFEIKIEGADKPLSIQSIGLRPLVIEESKYIEIKQCENRCNYEIEKSQRLMNEFSISCVPIYIVNDVNRIMQVRDGDKIFKCLIDSVSIPLGLGEMSITAHEVFI